MANFVSNVANVVLQYCTCCLHCCMFNSCMCCCAKCVGSDCVMCKCSLRSSPRFFLLQQLAKFVCACAFFATLQPSFPKLCQLMLDLFLEACVAHAQVIEVFVCCIHATWFCNVASLVLALAKNLVCTCANTWCFSTMQRLFDKWFTYLQFCCPPMSHVCILDLHMCRFGVQTFSMSETNLPTCMCRLLIWVCNCTDCFSVANPGAYVVLQNAHWVEHLLPNLACAWAHVSFALFAIFGCTHACYKFAIYVDKEYCNVGWFCCEI